MQRREGKACMHVEGYAEVIAEAVRQKQEACLSLQEKRHVTYYIILHTGRRE